MTLLFQLSTQIHNQVETQKVQQEEGPGQTQKKKPSGLIILALLLLCGVIYFLYSSFSNSQKELEKVEDIKKKIQGWEILTLEEITFVVMTPGLLDQLDKELEYGFGTNYWLCKWFKDQCGVDRYDKYEFSGSRMIGIQTHLFKEEIDGTWSFAIEIFSKDYGKREDRNVSEWLRKSGLTFDEAVEWLQKIIEKIQAAIKEGKLPSEVPGFFDDLR